jgi:hypothetical protein
MVKQVSKAVHSNCDLGFVLLMADVAEQSNKLHNFCRILTMVC